MLTFRVLFVFVTFGVVGTSRQGVARVHTYKRMDIWILPVESVVKGVAALLHLFRLRRRWIHKASFMIRSVDPLGSHLNTTWIKPILLTPLHTCSMCILYYIPWPDCSHFAWSNLRPCSAIPVDDPFGISPKHHIREIRMRVQHTLVWESATDDDDENPGKLCFPDGTLVDMSDTRCVDCRRLLSAFGPQGTWVRVEIEPENDTAGSGKGHHRILGCLRAIRAWFGRS